MDTQPTIDPDKLRAMLRIANNETLFFMLDDAIDLFPPDKLSELFRPYFGANFFEAEMISNKAPITLLLDVKDFDKRSRSGKYYESFDVNSKNCTEHSRGTSAFISDCSRLFRRCVAETENSNPTEVRTSFELLFELLQEIDACNDDIIFFADEGGSHEVGVNWVDVFPAWFQCLSKTAEPKEFAESAIIAVNKFDKYYRDKHFESAKNIGTNSQKCALEEALKLIH